MGGWNQCIKIDASEMGLDREIFWVSFIGLGGHAVVFNHILRRSGIQIQDILEHQNN